MTEVTTFANYTLAADVTTIAICVICFFLLLSTYATKQKGLFLFIAANSCIIMAACFNIAYSCFLTIEGVNKNVILACRDGRYIMLVFTMVIFYMYICDLVGMSGVIKQLGNIFIHIAMTIFIVIYLLSPSYDYIFWISYFYYMAIIACIIIVYRKRLVTKIYRCVRNVMLLAVAINVIEIFISQTDYLCITFTFPMIAVLFMFHYNSYDIDTGTLDVRAMKAFIKDLKTKEFSFIFLMLEDLNAIKMKSLSEDFIHFNEKFFRNPITFRVKDNKLVMIYKDSDNPNGSDTISRLLDDFYKLYHKHNMDYKIVLMHSQDIFNDSEDYLEFEEFVEERMLINTVYSCNKTDVEAFSKNKYIVSELKDISNICDLEDARVKVYCQPVLNTQTNTFTSAEALMRLELPKCGMVFPDTFIPLAEKYGYIHSLSKIILNKTCKAIKELTDAGYVLDRVSVNFSIIELRNEQFSEDVTKIILDNKISYDKIAVELTESRNQKDFEMVKKIMANLHKLGVKFYLDDFGTGYSNFERIIGLPIDIIKFDRSLTIMAGRDEQSRFLVGSFSDIFKKSNYQILFEGVENEKDERICKEMNAMYLQGYKYSKPIPIERLNEYLMKK